MLPLPEPGHLFPGLPSATVGTPVQEAVAAIFGPSSNLHSLEADLVQRPHITDIETEPERKQLVQGYKKELMVQPRAKPPLTVSEGFAQNDRGAQMTTRFDRVDQTKVGIRIKST